MKLVNNESVVQSTSNGLFVGGFAEVNDPTSKFDKTYGRVIVIGKSLITLHFGKKFAGLFGPRYGLDKTTEDFDPKVLVATESIKIKADELFGAYAGLRPLHYQFSRENICMVSDCDNVCRRRIIHNKSGYIHEFDMCNKHAAIYDGISGSFEKRPGYVPTVMKEIL